MRATGLTLKSRRHAEPGSLLAYPYLPTDSTPRPTYAVPISIPSPSRSMPLSGTVSAVLIATPNHATHTHTMCTTHSLTHLLTHSLTHSFTHSLPHSLPYSHTHLLAYSLTRSLTLSLTKNMEIGSPIYRFAAEICSATA